MTEQTRFAHASEAELARILDYYGVTWEYEPRTFPILWNPDGKVVESFSPDFYLPELDVYVELTTLKQSLVRRKNRKLRRLRELYPDIRDEALLRQGLPGADAQIWQVRSCRFPEWPRGPALPGRVEAQPSLRIAVRRRLSARKQQNPRQSPTGAGGKPVSFQGRDVSSCGRRAAPAGGAAGAHSSARKRHERRSTLSGRHDIG